MENTTAPRDAVQAACDVYNRTAHSYKTVWDGYTNPELDSFIAAVGTHTVLDAGCGPGRDLDAFTRLGVDAVGADLSEAMIALCAEAQHRAAVADLRALPYPDATFGGVWASASLVHLDQTAARTALAEFQRVTTPGGALFASVKQRPTPQITSGWEGRGDHGRFFHYWEPDVFAETVEACGYINVHVAVHADSARSDVTWIHVTATAT